jgi:hypothetical protein
MTSFLKNPPHSHQAWSTCNPRNMHVCSLSGKEDLVLSMPMTRPSKPSSSLRRMSEMKDEARDKIPGNFAVYPESAHTE